MLKNIVITNDVTDNAIMIHIFNYSYALLYTSIMKFKVYLYFKKQNYVHLFFTKS